jgi:superfamily II RNA helicase
VSKACYKEYLSLKELLSEVTNVGLIGNDGLIGNEGEQRNHELQPIFDFLEYLGYLERSDLSETNENKLQPTTKGILAAEINDSNCLLMTEMVVQGFFDILDGPEMLGLLALFIDESDRSEDEQSSNDKQRDLSPNLRLMIDRVLYMRDDLECLEEERVISMNVYPDTDWSVYLDFVPIAFLWASGCHISEIYKVSNIYEGNLVKSMLRLQNMAEGIVQILKTLEKHEQANKLQETSNSLIRDIVTNNSLYVTT